MNSTDIRRSLNIPDRIAILGAGIDPWTMKQTVDMARALAKERTFAHLIGVNADKLLQMRDDPTMNSIVHGCEIVNADGASMVLASKLLRTPLPERVAGIDLMEELCTLAANEGFSIYLLGAKPEVVEATTKALLKKHPELRIAGYRDGYFEKHDYDSVIASVNSSKPDFIFVGITSPKKEELIERFRTAGAPGVFVGVGGSFDVISAQIPRAPIWMQRLNLEWLFRMSREPRRLLRRYLVGNSRFALVVAAEAIRKVLHD